MVAMTAIYKETPTDGAAGVRVTEHVGVGRGHRRYSLRSTLRHELSAIFRRNGYRIDRRPLWRRRLEFQPLTVEHGLDAVPDTERMDHGFPRGEPYFVSVDSAAQSPRLYSGERNPAG